MKSNSSESNKSSNSQSSKSNTSESSKSNKGLSPEAEFSGKLTFRDYLIATEQKANKPLPFWRLLVPLALQTGLIMAVPTQALYTDVAGKTVILQSAPVDPDDVRQNYALNLDYNISRISTLRRLPGWEELLRQNRGRNRQLAQGTNLYVTLQERESFSRGVPRAWRLVRVSGRRPTNLANDQVALKGVYRDGFVNYGVERYYIPDEQRERISRDISRALESREGRRQPIVVKVKVDPQGNAVPISLWVRDRNYRF
ncbi:MAG: GDYXXLXY domain-containing protein [Aulosira sp. ZfuVER01]|nr:GDYXXLXY domain-containing protein [Aulosira sp. ZfuVER01]MDZ8002093.1 GDYXXLXY domain-containing protein [Aulosira sp. DedVER01a]MDZ8052640.1 GDYXXLXY domain-containing protein [Aulosira sp. ZfuCHP01]